MATFDLATLSSTIPYLDLSDWQGRTLCSLCFFDEDWKFWMHVGDRLMLMQAWPAETFYFAREPQQDSDLCFRTLNFIAQRASFPEVMKPFAGLQDDIFNLSASLEKLRHLHAGRDSVKHGLSRMAVTEVEYILSVCRSMFDLLQEIICKLWKTIRLLDPAVRKRELKKSFADMILSGGEPMVSTEISKKYGLPAPLAEAYARHAPFFLNLRKFRDNVMHQGSPVQTIFNGEQGFLIAKTLHPFSDWDFWRDGEKEPNDLVPLLPALGVVVYQTIAACDDLFFAIENCIQFPKPLVPGMAFFMRGYFNEGLLAVLQDANERFVGSQSPDLSAE